MPGASCPGHLEYDLVLPALSSITLSGSGDVVGEIAGSGSISYLGDPEVSRRIDGSGEIREA